jgi:hypothetical protein
MSILQDNLPFQFSWEKEGFASHEILNFQFGINLIGTLKQIFHYIIILGKVNQKEYFMQISILRYFLKMFGKIHN